MLRMKLHTYQILAVFMLQTLISSDEINVSDVKVVCLIFRVYAKRYCRLQTLKSSETTLTSVA